MRILPRAALFVGALSVVSPVGQPPKPQPDFEAMPFAPRRYMAYRTAAPLTVDGKLNEAAWAAVIWTDPFVDIEGDDRPRPEFRTRAKMLWDDTYFYVAAEMVEPDLWGTLRTRDAVIFHDNDFEVFIDPDGDTHAYYELEVNALGTPWDLMLIKPYRDGGRAIDGWDIAGLKIGIDRRGTINRPGDRDAGWTVELAMPWKILREAAPERRAPKAGEHWRVNFSRVEWQVSVANGRYVKVTKPGTDAPLPERNWVWSPQGTINMHMPERWGYVHFSPDNATSASDVQVFEDDPNERVKWALRRVYYRQRNARARTGAYAATLDELGVSDIRVDGLEFKPALYATPSFYEAVAPGFDKAVVHIDQDGRVWTVGGLKAQGSRLREEP
jgi:hypothetical protein